MPKTPRETIDRSILDTASLIEAGRAAELLSVTTGTLANWRCRNYGPPWTNAGRHVRYPVDGLKEWLAAQTTVPPASA